MKTKTFLVNIYFLLCVAGLSFCTSEIPLLESQKPETVTQADNNEKGTNTWGEDDQNNNADSTASNNGQTSLFSGALIVKATDSLPSCTQERLGHLFYIIDEGRFYFCNAQEYQSIDLAGPAGKDGENGLDGTDGVDGQDGTAGVNGIDGQNGIDGIDGLDGLDGTLWHTGSEIPDESTGKDGDYYLNTSNGDIFQRVNERWTITANIKGDTGEIGQPGKTGTTWLNGNDIPDPTIGIDGDYYLNTITNDVFQKKDDTWDAITNLKGENGSSGLSFIKRYSGEITSDGDTTIPIPEISGKEDSTFVKIYWKFSESSSIWSQCSDGWLDSTTSYGHICDVSWTYGSVFLFYFSAGMHYRIDVFGYE